MIRAVFAIPGDLATVTGGYLYEKRLLEGLRELGADVAHLQLAASFPDPSAEEMAQAVHALAAIPADRPVIVDGLVFGSIATSGLARVRAPIVAMIHHPLALEEGLDAARREHLYRTERDNLRLVAAVLVPSPHTARILVDEYGVDPARITVARPGTDRPTVARAPVDPPLILSVGIQHPRKGHDVLLRALALIRDAAWTAVVVGDAWDPAHAVELARLRDELGLGDRVRIAGRVTDAERDALYAAAGVFALATRYEGYGLVFDEALAWGLPIVSCRTGAVPETVPADAGLLVEPGDPAAFAVALRSVVAHARLRERMADAARRAGAGLPTWRDTAATAHGVLRELAGGSR